MCYTRWNRPGVYVIFVAKLRSDPGSDSNHGGTSFLAPLGVGFSWESWRAFNNPALMGTSHSPKSTDSLVVSLDVLIHGRVCNEEGGTMVIQSICRLRCSKRPGVSVFESPDETFPVITILRENFHACCGQNPTLPSPRVSSHHLAWVVRTPTEPVFTLNVRNPALCRSVLSMLIARSVERHPFRQFHGHQST